MFLDAADRSGRPAHYGLRRAAPLLDGLVVGTIPSFGNGSQSPLLALCLEAKPPISELGGNGRARERSLSPLDATPSFGGVQSLFFLHSTLGKPAFCRRGMDLPYIPRLALLVLELSV